MTATEDEPQHTLADPPQPDAERSTLHAAFDRSRVRLADAQEAQKAAQAVDKFHQALSAAIEEGRPGAALRVLAQNTKARDLLAEVEPRDAKAHDALEKRLRAEVGGAFQELQYTFSEAARTADLQLDATSRHPHYVFADGFLHVRFVKDRLETRIEPRDGKRESLGIDVPDVISHVRSQLKRLIDRPFDPATFYARVEGAYRKIAKGRESVPIKELAAELRKDKSHQDDEFNIDLSRFARSDWSGKERMRLDHTRDAKNGVLLWQLDARGYYGYVHIGGV